MYVFVCNRFYGEVDGKMELLVVRERIWNSCSPIYLDGDFLPKQ